MKWNWGTGIVFGMACFICFILYLVIRMTTEEAFEHDMVTENYYAKEMVYQKEIDAETNTSNLSENIKSKKIANGWEIIFPSEMEPSKIKGELELYRPSNKKLDKKIPLKLKDAQLIIPDTYLIGGRWNITIDWDYEGTPYIYKESIIY